ncbi:hypothetical protein ACRALDRAFT_2017523 [Sodiomyces alcalophilus JCM 7366]|uniref:uncharacterized protein n=1 Tax=Sodiomyces alcalophilus JCM 7366 TaxID=591952 RepID=UPI0039B64DF8
MNFGTCNSYIFNTSMDFKTHNGNPMTNTLHCPISFSSSKYLIINKMAKSKNDGVPNRHLFTRVSYLHQAACHLATVRADGPQSGENEQGKEDNDDKVRQNMARLLVQDLRAVSRKVLIRPNPAMKRTMCKMCDTVLVEGRTCFTTVENQSKGGRKPWADVMAMRCGVCGHIKRFPVNSPRQKRRPHRVSEKEPPKPDDEERTQKG